MRNKLIAAAGLTFLLSGQALARETAWLGIGIRPVNATTTSQTIEVSGVNVPREAMFCSEDSPVQIVTADFRYRNGDTQTLQLRARVRAGDCTRIFGLRNREAELTTVTFTADPASLAAGATARIWVLVR